MNYELCFFSSLKSWLSQKNESVLLSLVCVILSAAFCVLLKLYRSASEIVLQADNTLTYMVLIIL